MLLNVLINIDYVTDKLFNGIGEYAKYNEYLDIRQNKYWYDSYKNEYAFLKVALKFFEEIEKIENNIKTLDIDQFAKE